MLHIFLFEWKKRLKNRYLLVILLLVILFSTSVYALHHSIASNVKEANLVNIEMTLLQYNRGLQHAQMQLEDDIKYSEKEVQESTMDLITMYEKSINETEKQLNIQQNGQWQSVYENEITILTEVVNSSEEEDLGYSISNIDITPFTYRVTLHELDWLEEHNLEPFIQQTSYFRFLPNVYEDFEKATEHQWNTMTKRFSDKGFYYLYLMSQHFFMPLIIGFCCLVFGQFFIRKQGNGKLGLYATLPLSKWKFYGSGYATSLIAVLLSVSLIVLAPLAISLVLADLGSLQYPVLIYELNEQNEGVLDPKRDLFHFISLFDYFTQYMTLTIALIIFFFSCHTILSLILRNIVLRTVVFLTLILATHVMDFSPFNPLSYVHAFEIINGELALASFDPRYQVSTGIGVLLITSALLISIGYILFRWRAKPGYQ